VRRVARSRQLAWVLPALSVVLLGACAQPAPTASVPVARELPPLAAIPVLRAQRGRVILCVWDGLRPDSVDPAVTPNLVALGGRGVVFADHHATYPTLTMINAASLATGSYPDKTTFYGNTVWEPAATGSDRGGEALPFAAPIFSEDFWVLQALHASKAGRLLATDTLFQVAKRAGLRTATVGKSGPAFLQDLDKAGLLLDERVVWPPSLAHQLRARGFALPTTAPQIVDVRLRPDNGDPTALGAARTFGDGVTPDPSDKGGTPHHAASRYLLDAFVNDILELHAPELSVLWLRNPDSTQHVYGPGTANANDALSVQDALLGHLLERLETLDLLAHTDLMVVSDHGHSSVSGPLDLFPLRNVTVGADGKAAWGEVHADGYSVSGHVRLAHLLTQAGVPAFDGEGCAYSPVLSGIRSDGAPLLPSLTDTTGEVCGGEPGQLYTTPSYKIPASGLPPKVVVVASNGGTEYVYSKEHDPETISRVVRVLQSREEFGAVFVNSRYGSVPGTLPMSWINLESRGTAPDVVVSYNYDEDVLIQGVKGIEYQGGSHSVSRGMHGSFSPRDVHNTLIAAGPHFRPGFINALPTGNVDVAPTIAALLGLKMPTASGRVLAEAFVSGYVPKLSVSETAWFPQEAATQLNVVRPNGETRPELSRYTFQVRLKELRADSATYRYFDSAKAIRY
jgi:predicted AlkP superfamily pyrophosphatase or phosphodiesterase